MITIKSKKYKTFDNNIQNKYNFVINEELKMTKLRCSCGKKGTLIKHAYYYRLVRTPLGKVKLRILRVLCLECNKTHAIMIQSIVPYSQLLINQQLKIITTKGSDLESLMIEYEIEESHLRYIKKQYDKHWKQRLLHFNISLNNDLIDSCFHYFNQQFMQIKHLSNIFIS